MSTAVLAHPFTGSTLLTRPRSTGRKHISISSKQSTCLARNARPACQEVILHPLVNSPEVMAAPATWQVPNAADWLPLDELANAMTHGAGALLSVVAAFALVRCGAARAGLRFQIGYAVYAATLVGVYAASTIYHAARSGPLKTLMRVADHIGVYALIAGTYTPLFLHLNCAISAILLAVVWLAAVAFSAVKFRWREFLDGWPSTLSYVALGCVGVLVVGPIMHEFSPQAIAWLFSGGVAYLLGVVFFVYDDRPYFHAIWHLCVLAGSAAHLHLILCCLPAG